MTCGTRIVRLLPNGGWGLSRVQICDFNPYARHQVRNELDSVDHDETMGEGTQIVEEFVGHGARSYGEDVDEDGYPTSVIVTHEYVDAHPLPVEPVLDEPVVSALPYLETTTVQEFAVQFVLMDFENIYLLNVSTTCFQNAADHILGQPSPSLVLLNLSVRRGIQSIAQSIP